MDTHWVGTVSTGNDLSATDQAAIRDVLAPMNCHPIFMEEELIHGHYHGYCKTVMWPLFHNVEMLDSCGCVPSAWRGLS
jgi:trehalose 6-phosphate synthase/phosphatase